MSSTDNGSDWPTEISYSLSTSNASSMGIDLSWQAPTSRGDKLIYFISLRDPLALSQVDCRNPGENLPCFYTGDTVS